jgi:hypothetical protein
MKPALILFILLNVTLFSFAQEDAALNAKLQFSSLFLGTKDNFEKLKGALYTEDDNWSYYGSEYGLGEKAVTILKSKKDSTAWYCYIQFSMDTDMDALPAIQTGTFELLNMMITAGKIRGTEDTEDGITRTDLYVKSNDAWLGELVSDSKKKTFHILLKNTPWP